MGAPAADAGATGLGIHVLSHLLHAIERRDALQSRPLALYENAERDIAMIRSARRSPQNVPSDGPTQ